jgi:hypothetical protein
VADTLQQFERRQANLREHISNIETKIYEKEGIVPSVLIKQKEDYEKELRENAPRISLQPYYGHIVSYFWPIAFTCFGIVALLIKPYALNYRLLSISGEISIAVAVFIVIAGPVWLRTTPSQILTFLCRRLQFKI